MRYTKAAFLIVALATGVVACRAHDYCTHQETAHVNDDLRAVYGVAAPSSSSGWTQEKMRERIGHVVRLLEIPSPRRVDAARKEFSFLASAVQAKSASDEAAFAAAVKTAKNDLDDLQDKVGDVRSAQEAENFGAAAGVLGG